MQKGPNKNMSKKRYDKKNPVISCRISEEQRKTLDELSVKTGKSQGQLMRQAMNLELPGMNEVYNHGYQDGYRKARDKYGITIQCSECLKGVVVTSDYLKSKIRDIVIDFGCYHEECWPFIDPPEEGNLIIRNSGRNGCKSKKHEKQAGTA